MDFRGALLEETRAFGELIRSTDPSTEVPTCPGWTFKDLYRHVGRGNWWAAQMVADRRAEPLDPRQVRNGRAPEGPDRAVEWLNAGARLLIDSVDNAGPAAKVWTFLGPRPSGWWIRRRLHETTVHRADAALAVGSAFAIPPEWAADAVNEWIELVAVRARLSAPPLLRGQTLHLHATDPVLGGVGEWTVTSDVNGLDWTHDCAHGDDKAGVALRGPVNDLLLALMNRRSVADLDIEVFGDTALWDRWLDNTKL